MISRREFAAGAAAILSVGGPAAALPALQAEFARIEKEIDGRLGIAALDTRDGSMASYRADERFPMCSTFKALAAAAVLARVDIGKEQLDRRIRYEAKHLVTYSPVTEKNVETGMTLAEICEAAITLSDNTAGNLQLAAIGGPEGFTAYLRTLGDTVTRLDRIETALNEATPGDPRDTTTPAAMTENLHKLVLGDALSAKSRAQLKTWLVANKTGDTRIRAGVPAGWTVGDKTGTGERGTNNDVGILWPPGRAPMILCVYLTETSASFEARNATIAAVAQAVAAEVSR
jgi:beta-lactamase class A